MDAKPTTRVATEATDIFLLQLAEVLRKYDRGELACAEANKKLIPLYIEVSRLRTALQQAAAHMGVALPSPSDITLMAFAMQSDAPMEPS